MTSPPSWPATRSTTRRRSRYYPDLSPRALKATPRDRISAFDSIESLVSKWSLFCRRLESRVRNDGYILVARVVPTIPESTNQVGNGFTSVLVSRGKNPKTDLLPSYATNPYACSCQSVCSFTRERLVSTGTSYETQLSCARSCIVESSKIRWNRSAGCPSASIGRISPAMPVIGIACTNFA